MNQNRLGTNIVASAGTNQGSYRNLAHPDSPGAALESAWLLEPVSAQSKGLHTAVLLCIALSVCTLVMYLLLMFERLP